MEFEEIKNKMINEGAVRGDRIELDHSLVTHNSMGVGGNASVFCIPSSVSSIIFMREQFAKTGKDIIVIGNGTNMLVPDEGVDALVINLTGGSFNRLAINGTEVSAGSGVHLGMLIRTCITSGLSGLEGLAGIPGSVGGAVFMNASYRSAISDVLIKVKVLKDNNEVVCVEKDDIRFDYRRSSFDENDIILEAVFGLNMDDPGVLNERYLDFLREKKNSQPLGEKTLGCIFKNPEQTRLKAGEAIERSGMKGVKEGGAVVSEKHANFIVNEGGARAVEIKNLMEEMAAAVEKKFSIRLEPEIRIL